MEKNEVEKSRSTFNNKFNSPLKKKYKLPRKSNKRLKN